MQIWSGMPPVARRVQAAYMCVSHNDMLDDPHDLNLNQV